MSFPKKEEYTALFLQTFVCNVLSKVLCTIFGPHQWGFGLSLLRFFNHEHIKIIIFVLHTLSVRGLRLEWQNLLEYFPTIWFAGCKILSHGHQYQFLFLCTVYCTVSVYNVLYCFCVQCTVLFLCTMNCTVSVYNVLYCFCVQCTVLFLSTMYYTVSVYNVLYCFCVQCTVLFLFTMYCTVSVYMYS